MLALNAYFIMHEGLISYAGWRNSFKSLYQMGSNRPICAMLTYGR